MTFLVKLMIRIERNHSMNIEMRRQQFPGYTALKNWFSRAIKFICSLKTIKRDKNLHMIHWNTHNKRKVLATSQICFYINEIHNQKQYITEKKEKETKRRYLDASDKRRIGGVRFPGIFFLNVTHSFLFPYQNIHKLREKVKKKLFRSHCILYSAWKWETFFYYCRLFDAVSTFFWH